VLFSFCLGFAELQFGAKDKERSDMSLIECPECNNEVSDKAMICPKCGFPISGRGMGYEYISETSLFGLPLVHIAQGFDPSTGRPRVAKGIIAIGSIAVGGLAIGGLSVGVVSLGGLSLGLIALGGAAVGLLLALGGLAIGLVAIGGGAIGYYALGGGAFGVHPLGGNAQDPQAVEFFKRYLGSWIEQFQHTGRR
jgi:hypothetical protein